MPRPLATCDEKEKTEKEKANEKSSIEHSIWAKVVAGVFVTVLAPVLVAFGMKISDAYLAHLTPKLEPAKTESSKAEPLKVDVARTEPPKAAPPKVESAKLEPPKAEPTLAEPSAANSLFVTTRPAWSDDIPKNEIRTIRREDQLARLRTAGPVKRLFNLRDLTGWYTYVDKTRVSEKPPGRNKDPDGIYKVLVNRGTLKISGEFWGALITEKQYGNYHLTVEYRWGEKTWPPVEETNRQSGLLLHCFGGDGAHQGIAPLCIKCQINEGGTGDFVCYNGNSPTNISLAMEAAVTPAQEGNKKSRPRFSYQPGAPLTPFTTGFIRRLGNGNDWQNVKGFHRTGDIENPSGAWNTLECYCLGDSITVLVNGTIVNEAVQVKPSRGRIALQSHGAEIFFRKVELQPLAPP